MVRIHFRLTKGRNKNVSLSFLPVSFVSSTLQTSIRKLCIWIAKNQSKAYFQTGEKEKHQKTFKKIFPPLLPLLLKLFHCIQLPPTHTFWVRLWHNRAPSKMKAKLNCELLHSELLFCKAFFNHFISSRTDSTWFRTRSFCVPLSHSRSQPLGQAGQTCWSPVWFVATPYKEMELPPASPSAETSPLLKHNCCRKQTEIQWPFDITF